MASGILAISKCLKGERKSAGKHPITDKKLIWEKFNGEQAGRGRLGLFYQIFYHMANFRSKTRPHIATPIFPNHNPIKFNSHITSSSSKLVSLI